MKLVAYMMVVGAMWSCGVLAAEPGAAGRPTLSKAAAHQAAPKTRPVKSLHKQKAKPADKTDLKVQEMPKSSTVSPAVTEDSVQLKGVRG